jgi:hypothetical protein
MSLAIGRNSQRQRLLRSIWLKACTLHTGATLRLLIVVGIAANSWSPVAGIAGIVGRLIRSIILLHSETWNFSSFIVVVVPFPFSCSNWPLMVESLHKTRVGRKFLNFDCRPYFLVQQQLTASGRDCHKKKHPRPTSGNGSMPGRVLRRTFLKLIVVVAFSCSNSWPPLAGIANTLGRLVLGWISDRSWINRSAWFVSA